MVQLNPFKVKNEFDHYFSDDRREVSSLKPSLRALKFYLTNLLTEIERAKARWREGKHTVGECVQSGPLANV
jgi:hypothetical protein